MRYGVCRPEATRDRTFARRCGDTGAGDAGTDVGDAEAQAQVSDAGTDVSESEAEVHASDATRGPRSRASPMRATRLNRAMGATSLNRAKTVCDGLCVSLAPSEAQCSRRCVFGDLTECAVASGGLRRGGCLFVTTGGGLGDLGYCGELCDCTADCTAPGFVCDAFDASLERAFGRKGVCTPPSLIVSRALDCSKP